MKKINKDIFNPAFEDLKKAFDQAEKKRVAKVNEEHPRRDEEKPRRDEGIPQRAEGKHRRFKGKPHRVEDIPHRVEGESRQIEGKPQRVETEEDILFKKAMSDVIPISSKKSNKILPSGKRKKSPRLLSDDEQEVITHLQHLVRGSIDMDFTFSDEYVEGSLPGVSRSIMRRLKRGKIPVQDHLDLHGYTKKDAEDLVRNFLINSQRRGLSCVLIVHGRGLNSPDNIPILKERLPVWLNRGPVRKIVLAFSSARPYDGGTGALYVLLRKG